MALRILLSGYYGFGNLGDEALLEVIVEQLRQRFPEAIIEALSATPDQTTEAYGINATLRSDLRAVKNALRQADVVLSGGGGLLQNATSLKSLLYYAGIINLGLRMKHPTMIFAQSIGPLDVLGRRIVAKLCRHLTLATVRDTRSAVLLKRLLPEARIEHTADPVFLYKPNREPDQRVLLGLEREAGPFAVVSLRRSAQSEKVAKLVAQAVDHLAEQAHIKTVFVSFGGAADAEVATAVIRRCASRPLLLPHTDVATVAALIARAQIVVGMRLHALILAARFEVPFLALSYDPKVSALLEDLQYPLAPLWSSEQASPASVLGLVDQCLAEHDALALLLREQAEVMRVAAARNFDLLEEFISTS